MKRNKSKSSVRLHGVQVSSVSGNSFNDSPKFTINHTVGEPVTKVNKNTFVGIELPIVTELNSDKENTADLSGNVVK